MRPPREWLYIREVRFIAIIALVIIGWSGINGLLLAVGVTDTEHVVNNILNLLYFFGGLLFLFLIVALWLIVSDIPRMRRWKRELHAAADRAAADQKEQGK